MILKSLTQSLYTQTTKPPPDCTILLTGSPRWLLGPVWGSSYGLELSRSALERIIELPQNDQAAASGFTQYDAR